MTLEAGGQLEEGEAGGHSAHGPRRLESEDLSVRTISEVGALEPDLELLRGVVSGVGGLPGGGGGAASQGEQEPGRETKRGRHAHTPDTVLLTSVVLVMI